jgi:hypothetical protein
MADADADTLQGEGPAALKATQDHDNSSHTGIVTTTATASGDGAATTITLTFDSGDVGFTPTYVGVEPTSSAADGDAYVSGKSSTDVTLEYGTAPASGTDNLTFDILAVE